MTSGLGAACGRPCAPLILRSGKPADHPIDVGHVHDLVGSADESKQADKKPQLKGYRLDQPTDELGAHPPTVGLCPPVLCLSVLGKRHPELLRRSVHVGAPKSQDVAGAHDLAALRRGSVPASILAVGLLGPKVAFCRCDGRQKHRLVPHGPGTIHRKDRLSAPRCPAVRVKGKADLMGHADDHLQGVSRPEGALALLMPADLAGPAIGAVSTRCGKRRFDLAVLLSSISCGNKLALRISFMGGSSLRFVPLRRQKTANGGRPPRPPPFALSCTNECAFKMAHAQVCLSSPSLSGNLQRNGADAAIGTAT